LSEPELNNDINPNRGIEFILSGGKEKEKPKTFQVIFGNMIRFFKREFHFYLEINLDIKKDIPKGE
jgi:hypothetical protein